MSSGELLGRDRELAALSSIIQAGRERGSILAPLMERLGLLSRAHRDALGAALGLSDGARPDLFLIAEATFALLRLERASARSS